MLRAILQIHLYSNTIDLNHEEKGEFDSLLLIKQIGENKITLFSLIERSLKEFDPVQLRIPPNNRFDTPQLKAEREYYDQLTVLYRSGSTTLLRSLSTLANGKPTDPPMMTFSQRDHIEQTVKTGIKMLSSPLTLVSKEFSNVHNYQVSAFVGEFKRGFDRYIKETELSHKKIIQTNIDDFVKKLVRSCSLLAPKFKHDLLDPKHFMAGLVNDQLYSFLDGKVTFRELIQKALILIKSQKTLSVNGQLIVDTLHGVCRTEALKFSKKNSPPKLG